MATQKYYIVTDGVEVDNIYGDQSPICLCETEVYRLSAEWGVDLFEIMHEASPSEIAKYGFYDC